MRRGLGAVVLACGLAACIARQDLGDSARTATDAGTSPSSSADAGACKGLPCGRDQVASNGACVPRSTGGDACDTEKAKNGADTCAVDAFCRRSSPSGSGPGSCVVATPCGPGCSCATGPLGATCNTDELAGKGLVCLEGQCRSASDCPDGFRCLQSIGTLGFCSNGAIGSVCVVQEDCRVGTCAGFGYGLCL